MSDKTGTPYEILTQVIFQAILGQKDIPNLEVKHDVTLQGKTARHQIDVYWKFEVGGVWHEVIVQAKDWNKSVEQGQLFIFKTILEDLPGQPKGIFVTRTGYQQGAKEFALAHGILLYELREADYLPPLAITAGGWARYKVLLMPLHGLITAGGSDSGTGAPYALGFEVDIFTPHYSDMNLSVDKTWFESEYPHQTLDSLVLPPALPQERVFIDDRGSVVCNLGEIISKFTETMRNEGVERKMATHLFDSPVFVQTNSAIIPRLRITTVSMTIETTRTHEVRRLEMSDFPQLVLRQLNTDRSWWFAATPQVISNLSKKREA